MLTTGFVITILAVGVGVFLMVALIRQRNRHVAEHRGHATVEVQQKH